MPFTPAKTTSRPSTTTKISGGISKTLLTPYRRVGLSRKFKTPGSTSKTEEKISSILNATPEDKKINVSVSSRNSQKSKPSSQKSYITPYKRVGLSRRTKTSLSGSKALETVASIISGDGTPEGGKSGDGYRVTPVNHERGDGVERSVGKSKRKIKKCLLDEIKGEVSEDVKKDLPVSDELKSFDVKNAECGEPVIEISRIQKENRGVPVKHKKIVKRICSEYELEGFDTNNGAPVVKSSKTEDEKGVVNELFPVKHKKRIIRICSDDELEDFHTKSEEKGAPVVKSNKTEDENGVVNELFLVKHKKRIKRICSDEELEDIHTKSEEKGAPENGVVNELFPVKPKRRIQRICSDDDEVVLAEEKDVKMQVESKNMQNIVHRSEDADILPVRHDKNLVRLHSGIKSIEKITSTNRNNFPNSDDEDFAPLPQFKRVKILASSGSESSVTSAKINSHKKTKKSLLRKSLSLKKSSYDTLNHESDSEFLPQITSSQNSTISNTCIVQLEKLPLLYEQNATQITALESVPHNDDDDFATPVYTKTDIDTAKKRIKAKQEELEALKRAETYQRLHNVDELRELTKRWKNGCVEALQVLLPHLQTHGPIDMAGLLRNLKIPSRLIAITEDGELE